jgi:hypothetical protein
LQHIELARISQEVTATTVGERRLHHLNEALDFTKSW